MSRKHAEVKKTRWAQSRLGRTTDKITGTMQGYLDQITRTTYQPVPFEDLTWHIRTQRENRAYNRHATSAPARNAYERALYRQASYETDQDYLTPADLEDAELARHERTTLEPWGGEDPASWLRNTEHDDDMEPARRLPIPHQQAAQAEEAGRSDPEPEARA